MTFSFFLYCIFSFYLPDDIFNFNFFCVVCGGLLYGFGCLGRSLIGSLTLNTISYLFVGLKLFSILRVYTINKLKAQFLAKISICILADSLNILCSEKMLQRCCSGCEIVCKGRE